MNPCPLCEVVRAPGAVFIAELEHSVAILGENQGLPGWTVVVLKAHREQLHELAIAQQAAIFGEVARVARAVAAAVRPRRINYECLGNVVPHVHWHIIPRAADDPTPSATVWGWPAERLLGGMDGAGRSRVIAGIREALG